jgi:hypothetical protein
MFRINHHYQQSMNASQLGGKLLLGALFCAASLVAFAPGAAAQQASNPAPQPVGIDWSVQWNGTTVNANDLIQVNPTPVYVNTIDTGFDTPGALNFGYDGAPQDGYGGYSGLDGSYLPNGSPIGGDGGIYQGQVGPSDTTGGGLGTQDIPNGGNSQGGPSGNPLTPESYNAGGPPTRPSGTLVESGSISQQNTTSGGQGTVPIQTIAPY